MKQKMIWFLFFELTSSAFFISCRKDAAQSKAPIAIAGRAVTVQLPHDEILLDGSSSFDPDGEILQFTWSKISGPDFITITNKSSPKARLEFLTAGEYLLQLSVTDNSGMTSSDTVAVTILKYPAGHEIVLTGLTFYFDRFENGLYVRTNPRPDIFFNYSPDIGAYLNAEVLFKLTTSVTWTTLKPVNTYDPLSAVQYLYTINGDRMFVIRYPADPEFDGKPVTIKIKFN